MSEANNRFAVSKTNKKHMQLTNSNTNWPVINGAQIDIAALRALGYSVIVNSFRLTDIPYIIDGKHMDIPVPMPTYEIRRLNLQNKIRARGGYTTVKITKPGFTFTGEAVTHPNDCFCKGVGVKVALNKVIKQMIDSGAEIQRL